MKKFLFLDIDGVLRKKINGKYPDGMSAVYWATDPPISISSDCVMEFALLMSHHLDWDVIVTSSWKDVVNFNGQSIMGIPIAGVVPSDIHNRGREWEIHRFLADFPGAEWAVVDDDPLNYSGAKENVVICDPSTGFDKYVRHTLERMMS